jgi:hypothetical protein
MNIPCPYCKNQIDEAVFYCPVCGKKIKSPPVSTAFWPVAGLYTLSLLLPPFGIGLTIRYLKSPDPKAKKIGIISLIMTSFALVFVFWLTYYYTQKISQQVDREMQQYLGF